MKEVMWSFGMQSRPMFHVGDHPDIENVAKTAAEAGIREAVIFGKDHTGLCFHPTAYGVEHPNTKIDLTGEMTKALHKYNIRAIAYFNMGQDGEMGRRHADWLQEFAPGVTSVTPDHYANICVFHDYLHKYMLPVLLEMFEKYHVDGVFLDTMFSFGYCCCPKCRKAFESETGQVLPLPANPEDGAWKVYGPWQFKRSNDFIRCVRETILAKYPEAVILFNHLGGPSYPYAMPGIEKESVSCDPMAYYPWVSVYASYLSSLKNGGDIFIERFSRGWGDRCDLEDRTMQYKCASIFVHRQRFCVGDRMHPDGRYADGSVHAMKLITSVWKKFNKALPDRLKRTGDYIFLMPESYRCGKMKENFSNPNWNFNRFNAMFGPFHFLLNSGFSFQTVPEFALKRNLALNKTVIISNAESLNDETHELLKEFVREGGKILFGGRLPVLPDGSLPEYCGIASAEKSLHRCVYMPGKVRYGRILVPGTVWDLTLKGAKKILSGYPQDYAEVLKDTNMPYYNAAASSPMEQALLTVNRYGKGSVCFLNCGFFDSYVEAALPALMQWGRQLFMKLFGKGSAYLETVSGNVELVSYEDVKGGKVFALVNHGGREGSLRKLYLTEHISDPQPAYAVKLCVRSDRDLQFTCGKEKLPAVRKGKYLTVSFTMDSMWKFIKAK